MDFHCDEFWGLVLNKNRSSDEESRYEKYLTAGWLFDDDNIEIKKPGKQWKPYLDRGLNELGLRDFKYPLAYYTEENYRNIPTVDLNRQDNDNSCKNFPHNISKVIAKRPGENDGAAWILVGQLENNSFFYFHAWCDYTGFDCKGGITLHICDDYDLLINNALSDKEIKILFGNYDETSDEE